MGECTRGQDVEMSRDGEKAKVLKGIRPLGTRDVCAVSFATIAMSWASERFSAGTYKLRNVAMDALMDLIKDLKAAKSAGKSDAELATAQTFQRKAQFYLDFVEAENSTGFHAPQEAARILGESVDFSRKGQIAVRDGSKEASAQKR
jgi:hypothetical protein